MNRVEHGPSACDAPTVKEVVLQEAVVKAINLAYGQRSEVIEQLRKNLERVIDASFEEKRQQIDDQLKELQKQLLEKAKNSQDYMELEDQILDLREELQRLLVENAEQKGKQEKMNEMMEFLDNCESTIAEYDEQLTRKLVERVDVLTEGSFRIHFKSGAEVEV